MMKPLIVYYSRSGKNRAIAEKLNQELGGDMDEIDDWLRNLRYGIMFWGGMYGSFRWKTRIRTRRDPKNYSKVILIAPVWAWHLAPAARSYLIRYKKSLQEIAVVSVCGGGKKHLANVVDDYRNIMQSDPKSVKMISEEEFADGNYDLKKLI